MRPTQEQVIVWAREVWGDDSGKPWSDSALLHITKLAILAYEAGRKDEVNRIVNLMMIQHEAAKERHNYWHCAANLIQAEVASDT